jgi:formylglycine-generating enzyme required for sulfatase activity
LPTEAQWEYACRAGKKTTYGFGRTLNARQANFGNSQGKTIAVASYAANAWGLYDMHGNVWEWCEDWYGDQLPGGTDPTGVPSGMDRVIRGGNWYNGIGNCRAADRLESRPIVVSSCQGFRVALSR